MAYQNNKLTPVATTVEQNLFFYPSDEDTTLEIVASGYFNPTVDERTPRASILTRGSCIIVSDGDTTQTVVVTSEQGVLPVTVA